MNALQYNEYGGLNQLHWADAPTPTAGPSQVVVQVKAASLTPPTTKCGKDS